MGPAPTGPIMSGRSVSVRTSIRLPGLKPEDVRVECVIGRIGSSGRTLKKLRSSCCLNKEVNGDVAVFEKDVISRLNRAHRLCGAG